jgi:cytochrome c oxidase subunit 2
MLFNVEIVSQNEYQEHLDTLRDLGQTGEVDVPLRGSFSTEPLSPTGSDQ